MNLTAFFVFKKGEKMGKSLDDFSSEITPSDQLHGEQLIRQWYQDKKFPSKAQLDEQARSGGLIYVDSYTKADGTEVSGYYRRPRLA